MKQQIICFSICLFFYVHLSAQEEEKAKLVIGVVVDQMRYDYIDKYWNDFGEGGFKKLVNQGFFARNVRYHYKPTYTGPGHASIFTGAPPALHGIVGNNWYSKMERKVVYCAEIQGGENQLIMSPKRLKGRTIADQIKLATNGKGKVFGISLKDRGAILPAGHLADAAYWFSSKQGHWVTSSYYGSTKRNWLNKFNQVSISEKYLKDGWSLSLAKEAYDESHKDTNNYENELYKGSGVTFPYNLDQAAKIEGLGIIKSVPQGNTMTTDLALTLIREEGLGNDNHMDFLSISYSATDYVGHRFGVGSVELQDTYIKLDKDIAHLISELDSWVGRDQYILFLTSDHGAGEVRNHLADINAPHGYLDTDLIEGSLESSLDQRFGEADWIEAFINLNVYLNDSTVLEMEIDKEQVIVFAKKHLLKQSGVLAVWAPDNKSISLKRLDQMVENGYHQDESGDLILVEKTSWSNYSSKGSTHGSPYNYDTHVPLIFFGKGVVQGVSYKSYNISSIAPTVSALVKVPAPELSSLEVIREIIK